MAILYRGQKQIWQIRNQLRFLKTTGDSESYEQTECRLREDLSWSLELCPT